MRNGSTFFPRLGYGFATGHHGELLQGAFTRAGAIVRALVTMPFPSARSCARFLTRAEPGVTVEPAEKRKAARAAELTLTYLDLDGGGALEIITDIPQGLGLGSSSADAVAAIRAVASAFGTPLPSGTVAQLAVAAEHASDGIMFERPVLFAHREGRVVEHFDAPLPPLKVLSVLSGAPVDTLGHPAARYSISELYRFDELRDRLRMALRRQDTGEIASVATESARINQRHLPLASYERLEEIGDTTGALGIQTAHSGAVTGLIFDALDPAVEQSLEAARTELEKSGETVGETFSPGISTNQKEAV